VFNTSCCNSPMIFKDWERCLSSCLELFSSGPCILLLCRYILNFIRFYLLLTTSGLPHTSSRQLGFTSVPAEKPNTAPPSTHIDSTGPAALNISEAPATDDRVMRDLHTLLLETQVREGKMVCGNCGHEYKIKEGIANFLLPSHLGRSCLLELTKPSYGR